MQQRLCQLGLLVLIVLVGCKSDRATPPRVRIDEEEGEKKGKLLGASNPLKNGEPASGDGPVGYHGDEVVASLPEPTKQQLYDQALLEAVDHLAEQKYAEALAALEKAQKYNDTGAVQREIYKVRAILDQQTAAERAVQDIKTVLDDGKPEEAARLAGTALGQYGGGDRAEELAKLKQEAEAVVSATADNPVIRRAALRSEAEAALKNSNLRAAAVALEQAVALGEDAALSKQLTEVRTRLETYDDCRSRAALMRRDPTQVDEALTLLRQANEAWSTLQVQQEIDECQLILERRRDRLSVADLEVLGDVGLADAGRIVAADLLPHFRPKYDLVERAQVSRLLAELNLEPEEVADNVTGRSELVRAARLRYLVVGSLSPLAGVTLQARLVEVPTGLIVQTARVSAATVEELVPKLKAVAMMLQMSDEQKLAFEEALQQKVVAVKPIDDQPVEVVPPPPPPPAPKAPPPPPIVTWTPRPPATGGLVIQDFARQPPVVVAPQPLAVVIPQNDPRRNRLFRLSLELGDNCFRRGMYQEAQRHFSLAVSIGGPRRELSLRLDAVRGFMPPPPPPPVVIMPPPPPPVVIMPRPPVIVPPPPPVVVVRPPVVIMRPRVAVFGFVLHCRPGLVPSAASEVLADQFASYCRGSYEIIDRGEVCWYMGRLGLTMKDVLCNEISRRCLAQALNARFFVFGTVQETASFDVETQLIDPETGRKQGVGKIHVKDQQELKLRIGELARQIGAKPEEQKTLAAKGAASEKALNEARGLLAKDPAKAAEVARAGLKESPNSVALQTLAVDAERRVRQAKLEEQRRVEASRQAKLLAEQKKRDEELRKQASEARARAEKEATTRTEAQRKQQQAQRERAASSLRTQAKAALARGNAAQAVQQLQSAANLQPSEAVFKELAEAKLAVQKESEQRALAEQKKREEARRQEREAAAKRVQAEKADRERVDSERRKTEQAQTQKLHDGLVKQAQDLLGKKEYAKALAAAESAQRYRSSPEATQVMREARDQLAMAGARDASEKKRLEQERKEREENERKQQKAREAYSATLKRAQDALVAKKYDEAVTEYQAAGKLFNTDAVRTGLKTAQELRDREKSRQEAEAKEKLERDKRMGRLRTLLDDGKKARSAKEYDKAVSAYREAVKLDPRNVEAVAGLSAAERERTEEATRITRARAMRERQDAIVRNLTTARAAMSKKQPAEATKAARAVLALDPDNVDAKAILAEVSKTPTPMPMPSEKAYREAMQRAAKLMAEKKYPQAENAYDEALKAKPGDTEAIQGKRAAIAATMKTMPSDPRAKAYQTAMAQAKTLMDEKKYGQALQAYVAALEARPNDPAATKGRAEAVRELREATYTAAMTRGQQALKAKQFAEAQKAFDEALKVKPNDAAALAGKKAATPTKPMPPMPPTKKDPMPPMPPTKKDPMPPTKKEPTAKEREEDYKLALGAGRAALKVKNYRGAVNAYREALRLKPGDPVATRERVEAVYGLQMQLADQAMKQKKFADAIEAYDAALKVKPGDPQAIRGKKEATAAAKP